MLAKNKLNGIDTLISQALIDMDITHEEFITILKEKDRDEMMKENLRNENGELYEIMRFNSVKSNKSLNLNKNKNKNIKRKKKLFWYNIKGKNY